MLNETPNSRMTHYSAVPFTMSSQDSEERKREIWKQPDFYPILEKVAALELHLSRGHKTWSIFGNGPCLLYELKLQRSMPRPALVKATFCNLCKTWSHVSFPWAAMGGLESDTKPGAFWAGSQPGLRNMEPKMWRGSELLSISVKVEAGHL